MGACGSLTGSHYYLFYNQLNRGQGALGGKGSLAAGWGRVLQMTLMKILLKKFQMLFLLSQTPLLRATKKRIPLCAA